MSIYAEFGIAAVRHSNIAGRLLGDAIRRSRITGREMDTASTQFLMNEVKRAEGVHKASRSIVDDAMRILNKFIG